MGFGVNLIGVQIVSVSSHGAAGKFTSLSCSSSVKWGLRGCFPVFLQN